MLQGPAFGPWVPKHRAISRLPQTRIQGLWRTICTRVGHWKLDQTSLHNTAPSGRGKDSPAEAARSTIIPRGSKQLLRFLVPINPCHEWYLGPGSLSIGYLNPLGDKFALNPTRASYFQVPRHEGVQLSCKGKPQSHGRLYPETRM